MLLVSNSAIVLDKTFYGAWTEKANCELSLH